MPIINGISNAFNTALANSNPLIGAWEFFAYLFFHGGWLFFAALIVYSLFFYWVYRIQNQYESTKEWLLLAIDVPKDNVQSPKAVENIFATLAGAHGTKTLWEKYWEGATQDWFSLEIISIDGYVQFIIRTVARFRDLVEGAVYAQYPDAEVTEIEDYTDGYPTYYPNERYNIYGTEFVLVEDESFPIRTYIEFEHTLSQEFKDPMSSLLEVMGKLGESEQLWLQIIIVPISDYWKKHAVSLMRNLIGERQAAKKGIFSAFLGELGSIGRTASEQVTGTPGGAAAKVASDLPSKMLYLSPYDKERVEGISRKIKKLGFETKIRSIYVASKEKFFVQHGREALIGAIKQFNTTDLNSLKPDTKHVGVHAAYLLAEWRKDRKRTKIMRRYKNRSPSLGRGLFVLNIEELATIWHFPLATEQTPVRYMVQKTDFKRIAPPSVVPFAGREERTNSALAPPHTAPPFNLPLSE